MLRAAVCPAFGCASRLFFGVLHIFDGMAVCKTISSTGWHACTRPCLPISMNGSVASILHPRLHLRPALHSPSPSQSTLREPCLHMHAPPLVAAVFGVTVVEMRTIGAEALWLLTVTVALSNHARTRARASPMLTTALSSHTRSRARQTHMLCKFAGTHALTHAHNPRVFAFAHCRGVDGEGIPGTASCSQN